MPRPCRRTSLDLLAADFPEPDELRMPEFDELCEGGPVGGVGGGGIDEGGFWSETGDLR